MQKCSTALGCHALDASYPDSCYCQFHPLCYCVPHYLVVPSLHQYSCTCIQYCTWFGNAINTRFVVSVGKVDGWESSYETKIRPERHVWFYMCQFSCRKFYAVIQNFYSPRRLWLTTNFAQTYGRVRILQVQTQYECWTWYIYVVDLFVL